MNDHTPTPPGFVAIENLPSTFRGFNLASAVADSDTLTAMARCVADAWLELSAHASNGEVNRKMINHMGALVWLQVDLCETLSWKIARLDDSHRLVERKPAGATTENRSD